jgi:hypothetical protein
MWIWGGIFAPPKVAPLNVIQLVKSTNSGQGRGLLNAEKVLPEPAYRSTAVGEIVLRAIPDGRRLAKQPFVGAKEIDDRSLIEPTVLRPDIRLQCRDCSHWVFGNTWFQKAHSRCAVR